MPFDKKTSLAKKYKLSVKINGQDVAHTFESTMKSDVRTSVKITPNSVSPVLKTEVTIELESAFPHALKREDFTVNATGTRAGKPYVRYLNVKAVDDTDKTLTCMFGGAWSGKF